VAEALASSLEVVDVIVSDAWEERDDTHQVLDRAHDRGVSVRSVVMTRIERIATTTSPQPVVAEVELPSASWDDVAAASSRADARAILAVVDLNDPGNLGTIARSAVAAGFDAVAVLGDSADPFGPKSVRASAGAIFHVPVVIDRAVGGGMDCLADLGVKRIGTRMASAIACDQADLTQPVALVLGNEAHGLGEEVASMIDEWVAVPMAGPVESLNVAMAATVLSYEVFRQRRSQA